MRSVLLIYFLTVLKYTTLADDDDNADPELKTQSSRIANKLDEPKPVNVSKCCPDQETLDVSNPKQPFCVNSLDETSPFIEIIGLDLDSSNRQEVKIQLTEDQRKPSSLPSCYSGFELHRIEDSGIKL